MIKIGMGFGLPLGVALVLFFIPLEARLSSESVHGLRLGAVSAALLSVGTMGALWLARKKKSFYWVWGAGMLVRLLGLGALSALAYFQPALSAPWTLISFVLGSLVFLLIEGFCFFY